MKELGIEGRKICWNLYCRNSSLLKIYWKIGVSKEANHQTFIKIFGVFMESKHPSGVTASDDWKLNPSVFKNDIYAMMLYEEL